MPCFKTTCFQTWISVRVAFGQDLISTSIFQFPWTSQVGWNSILTKFIKVKSHFEMGVIVTEFTVAFRLRTYGKCWHDTKNLLDTKA